MGSYWGGRLSSVIVGVSDSFFPRIVRLNGNRLMALTVLTAFCGCVSDKVREEGPVVDYQQQRAAQGPQARIDTEGTNDQLPLGLITPTPRTSIEVVEERIGTELRAAFAAEASLSHTPLTVSFTDRSLAGSSSITSWLWSFGDPASGVADTSTVQNPSHTYNDFGTYTVTLTVTSADLSDTIARANIIPAKATSSLTGRNPYNLTLGGAITRTLSNSTEITAASFDPEIAKQDITQQTAQFEPVFFAQIDRELADRPISSRFDQGESDIFLYEAGIRQRTPIGSEWNLSFGMTRSWDDLTFRDIPLRYEPVLMFQLRQPLLRDAWAKVNLAGVNVSRLNHKIALERFRQIAEDIGVQIIQSYWALYQARQVLVIQRDLYDRTNETLKRLLNRTGIDVTSAQVTQAEAALYERQSTVQLAEKRVFDTQDSLQRLMADAQLNLTEDIEVVPVTPPNVGQSKYNLDQVLAVAMRNNPAIEQRRIALTIADINVKVANYQRLPRLDLVSSVETQSLADSHGSAMREFRDIAFVSYSIGVSFEYPIGGNRARKAEARRREYERLQAISTLQGIADQVASGVKEALRSVETSYSVMGVEKSAIEAARAHLTTLDAAEAIMQRLTPEFLLVKLQAQQDLAEAQRREVVAIVDYNVSLVRLAQASGTVLRLHPIESAMSAVTNSK